MTLELATDVMGPRVCVGEILVEIVATTIGNSFRAAQPLIEPFPGGAPAILIFQYGKLGGKTAIQIDSDYPTGSAFVRYRKDGSRDFVFNVTQSAAVRFWTSPSKVEGFC